VIGSVTETQQQLAEIAKCRSALPPVPQPEPSHVSWAKRTMADGYQASVRDRVDATRILDAAGLSADDFHGGREPDSAPPGARDVAAAHLERERAETERTAPKATSAHGSEGPGEGVPPGHPEPGQFGRGYVEPGHASPSPQSEGPRVNPLPGMPHYVLPDMPYASRIPQHDIARYTAARQATASTKENDMSVMYARNDIRSIAISEAHGGCGQPHERGAGPDGTPEDFWFVDCPQCEMYLASDPLWAKNPDDVPESPDEAKATAAFEARGSKALSRLRVLALAKMAGVAPAEISPELSKMLTAGPVRVPGITVCSAGHDNAPGSRYCSSCGTRMGAPAASAIAAGDGR